MSSSEQCIFCRIARGELPSERVHEDEHLIAFRDIQPAAPVHILLIPREHVASVAQLKAGHLELAGRLMLAVREIAAREGLDEQGYRIASNVGVWGGQSVDHLHVHILGGRQLGTLG